MMFAVMGWAIIIAFIATTIITLLGIMGRVKFKNYEHLNKLFTVLILEIVACGFYIFKIGISADGAYARSAAELLKQAVQDVKEKKYHDADVGFSKILSQNDGNVTFRLSDVFKERANSYYIQEKWPLAAHDYDIYYNMGNAGKLTAQDVKQYGRSLRETDRYEDALALYLPALAKEPGNYDLLNGLQNVYRRRGMAELASGQTDASDKDFRDSHEIVNNMLNTAKIENDHKKIKNAMLANFRLLWAEKQYETAMAAAADIFKIYPNFSNLQEDVAELELNYGIKNNDSIRINHSIMLYKNLIDSENGNNNNFARAGYAEAISYSTSAKKSDFEKALYYVNSAISANDKKNVDTYGYYAKAIILKKLQRDKEAIIEIKRAISIEKKKSSNFYITDFEKLSKYENTLNKWKA